MQAETNGEPAPGEPVKKLAVPDSRRRQLGFWPSIMLLLPAIIALGSLSVHWHYTLPAPVQDLVAPDGQTAQFCERQAMQYINDLATHEDGSPRYRIVGTEEMVATEKYIVSQVERIRNEVVAQMGDYHQIEIWHQVNQDCMLLPGGSRVPENFSRCPRLAPEITFLVCRRRRGLRHVHSQLTLRTYPDFMDKKVWKRYFEIGNVIVRLSDGTAASKQNAVLVNAHTDSTLPSPGAADDLLGVAVMLEALRVMALTERRLTNSVIFRELARLTSAGFC